MKSWLLLYSRVFQKSNQLKASLSKLSMFYTLLIVDILSLIFLRFSLQNLNGCSNAKLNYALLASQNRLSIELIRESKYGM